MTSNTFLLHLVLRQLPIEAHSFHPRFDTYYVLDMRIALWVAWIEFHIRCCCVNPSFNFYQHAVFEKIKMSKIWTTPFVIVKLAYRSRIPDLKCAFLFAY